MLMSRHRNAAQSHNIKRANGLFDNMAKLKYLGRSSTNEKSIYEETKSRFHSRNACYISVQDLLSLTLLSRNFFYLVCEAISTAAIPGLFCQPRVIVKMIVEKQMECRLAGETEDLES
jgi:hypothetical protein